MFEWVLWITLVPTTIIRTSGPDAIMVAHDVSVQCLTTPLAGLSYFILRFLQKMYATEAASFEAYVYIYTQDAGTKMMWRWRE